LWDADRLSKRLGEEGYPWFVERANKFHAKCEACHGTGRVAREPKKFDLPNVPKFVDCWECAVYLRRLEDFAFVYFLQMPAAYRRHTLKNLQPFAGTQNAVSLEKQRGIIDMLKKEPESGWMFFGPPHCGKTTWTTALYADNLYKFFIGTSFAATDRDKINNKTAVWRVKAKALLDAYQEWSMKRFDKDKDGDYCTEQPEITPEKIKKYRRLGVKSKLYLEEMDKVSLTDARSNNLFEILDAMHEEEGIVVLNSNLTPDEFINRFGEQFTWRMNENSKVINLFEK
jgi:hypothetical protein